MLTAKHVLTGAVAKGLMTVLDVDDPGAESGRADAVAALRQELAISLSAAYDIAAIIQYDASVNSPWTRDPALAPARLLGSAQPAAGALRGPGTEPMPYTLTTAKTALDQENSLVTFLMRVPDPSHHGVIGMTTDYALSDLEFGIEPVQGIDGFEDSRWLSFYPPLAGKNKPRAVSTSLGAATVPVPLRAYPSQPVILGQAATASKGPRAPSLADCRLWTYSLSYAHEHAEQDEVLVTANFNVAKESPAVADEADDVAIALAKYMLVADGLWALLAHYAGASNVTGDVAAAAASSFAELVKEIADSWDVHWARPVPPGLDRAAPAAPGSAAPGPAPRSYAFRVWVDYADLDGGSFLATVTLEATGDELAWPLISCRRPDGTLVDFRRGEPDNRLCVYRVPRDDLIPAGEPPAFVLSWPDLPIAEFQNARAELSVRRNQRLGGPERPTTREAFVYQTPPTQAPAPIVPLLSWPDAVDITDLEGNLPAALRTAFGLLCSPSSGLPATVGILYGHPMALAADPAETLSAFVPVSLAPNLALTADAAERIAEKVDRWTRDHEPAVVPGRSWAFSLAIYSELDEESRQPLLSLDQLVYRIL